jgi:DNA-binding XRE family transcriptional regulator
VKQDKKWKERARSILADYKEGRVTGPLTQSGLAQKVAVSRQTLWRDEEIRSLYATTQDYLLNIKKKGRKDSCARIFALETQLEKARAENNRLIQIIIKAAQLMTEDAIDPRRYFGDATT